MEEYLKILENCRICPRNCRTNRVSDTSGYCRAGAGYEIASISVHKGEEPVISGEKGICNVFFSHCNMQCVFCQNYQISGRDCRINSPERSLEEVVHSITTILDTGIESLGFVSPSHMIPQMKAIIHKVHEKGYYPYIVFNTNAYDTVETLKELENLVDVYLPDYKYSDKELSFSLSDAVNYPEIAGKAIKEMYRQKGNVLHLNERGIAERGLIVRHLVLPGEVENSLGVMRYLSEEISNRIYLSLMSQYYPIPALKVKAELNRTLHKQEYSQVIEEMESLGFSKGWVQGFDSANFYLPDFESKSPFK